MVLLSLIPESGVEVFPEDTGHMIRTPKDQWLSVMSIIRPGSNYIKAPRGIVLLLNLTSGRHLTTSLLELARGWADILITGRFERYFVERI